MENMLIALALPKTLASLSSGIDVALVLLVLKLVLLDVGPELLHGLVRGSGLNPITAPRTSEGRSGAMNAEFALPPLDFFFAVLS